MQSSFSGVRRSYMFTEQSFPAVKDCLRQMACWSSIIISENRGWWIVWRIA
jgi:hypothetical protein